MIPVDEARQRICESIRPLATETIPLNIAMGRVLARTVKARVSQPPAAVSAMDGYAVRAADATTAPTDLEVVAEVPAGRPHDGNIASGQAARIFTGALLPNGTDSIVIQENTKNVGKGKVRILETASPGKHVRAAGIDFREGDELIETGKVLSARDVGLAAAGDNPWLVVRRRPRVALLATGDEIVLPGEPRTSGQIVSSNTFSLSAIVSACGGEASDLGPIPDDPGALNDALEAASLFDLLVTTGGVSVGDHDLVGPALKERGLDLSFWKIAMRPGKPLLFGKLPGGPAVLGIPGNPVSAVVCSMVFLRPALRSMLGLPDDDDSETAVLGRDLPANDRREDYLRATLSRDQADPPVVTPFDLQDSSMMSLLASADCLAVRPMNAPAASAGDEIKIFRFPFCPGGF